MQKQLELWKKYLPDIKPYYAVKCNPEPTLLRWLSWGNTGFDCASAREMEMCRFVTISSKNPYNIVFANPCKTSHDIEIARDHNVPWTTVDCVEELDKMKSRAFTPELLIRVAVDDKGSDMPFSSKFGVDSADGVKNLYSAATSLGFSVRGFSFHVGSGCRDMGQYTRAINLVDHYWGLLKARGAKDLQTIDIGGGFRANEDMFVSSTKGIRAGLEGLTVSKGAEIIAEPGRFFATPSHDLFVKVVGKKPGLGGVGWRYTIDESVYGQFSCIPFDGQKPPFARVVMRTGDETRKKTKAIIFGRTCDSMDVISYGSEVEELEIGDWLYFPWMGAYTTVTSSEFNGFPKPPVIYSNDKNIPDHMNWLSSCSPILNWVKGAEYALETKCKI